MTRVICIGSVLADAESDRQHLPAGGSAEHAVSHIRTGREFLFSSSGPKGDVDRGESDGGRPRAHWAFSPSRLLGGILRRTGGGAVAVHPFPLSLGRPSVPRIGASRGPGLDVAKCRRKQNTHPPALSLSSLSLRPRSRNQTPPPQPGRVPPPTPVVRPPSSGIGMSMEMHLDCYGAFSFSGGLTEVAPVRSLILTRISLLRL